MRLLMLGGTEFVGRAVVEAAVRRGWEVTLFHRGRNDVPRGARALLGDRTAPDGLAALAGGAWDAVVDTWSGAPRAVRETARLLSGRAGRYAYVSSCSVYEWPRPAGFAEDMPAVDGADAGAERTDYARDKRGGELAAVESFGADASLLVRAGLILGPYENVGRLPWWLHRIARGGDVLAPGPRELAVPYVDARDLSEWLLSAVERGSSGPYNVAGTRDRATMGELLDACVRVTGGTARLRWTAPEAVLAAGIEPWTQLPVWVPHGSELETSVYSMDVSRAVREGLRHREVAETVADTWAWLRTLDGPAPRRTDRPGVGLDPAVEARVLAASSGTAEA
ncbi:NAD-dependent epimerase/dehydratase family protein [Streptomyces sp. NBC_00670]|uniref:NAD-dependent epimerase/dehydratase family protein n=1 Tax=Streptomyces sp. NBC_00670 TaxID=2975804 RepID=UPI002E33CC67|nr:NAD-dependent epimerase/dehydratase family protein [Streptomyces sp. NBC_00670]